MTGFNARLVMRHGKRALNRVRYFGQARYCPVCDNGARRFLPHGVVKRPEARCPMCGALERHRLMWLFFQRRTNLLDGTPKRMLHVAPEVGFQTKLTRAAGLDYLSADLLDPDVMVKMDITDIQYPDASFDVIYCSHVLEHVPDDRKAIREFHRVLRPTGWAVIQVPITAEETFEDPTITDPAERERLFGQHDHVRRYGPDYLDRLREAGFRVELVPVPDVATQAEVAQMGLPVAEEIFLCRRLS
jgi:SAM-dependent methyltransferase